MHFKIEIKTKPNNTWPGKILHVLSRYGRRIPYEVGRKKVFRNIWAAKQSYWKPLSKSWLDKKRRLGLMLPIWTATGATLDDLTARTIISNHTKWLFNISGAVFEAQLHWDAKAIEKYAPYNEESRPFVDDDVENDPVVAAAFSEIIEKFADNVSMQLFTEWHRR